SRRRDTRSKRDWSSDVCSSDLKTAELTELFSDLGFSLGFVTLDEAGFDGEIAEDGNSFEDNALIKARTAARECNMTAVADDSGQIGRVSCREWAIKWVLKRAAK